MVEKLITKSFERLLEKGKTRGFITYEELGKSLGKRGGSNENVEKAFFCKVNLCEIVVAVKHALWSGKAV